MKAISVKQPWANLIAQGKKTIETRTWSTGYRGRILIVSSRVPKIDPAGFAVAIATIADCRKMTRRDERGACCKVYPRAWAWVLEDIQPIKPWRVKGQLRIFEVDDDEVRNAIVNQIHQMRISSRAGINTRRSKSAPAP